MDSDPDPYLQDLDADPDLAKWCWSVRIRIPKNWIILSRNWKRFSYRSSGKQDSGLLLIYSFEEVIEFWGASTVVTSKMQNLGTFGCFRWSLNETWCFVTISYKKSLTSKNLCYRLCSVIALKLTSFKIQWVTPGLGAGSLLATKPGSGSTTLPKQSRSATIWWCRDPVPVPAHLPRPGEEGGEQQGGGDRHQAQGAPAGDAREHLQGGGSADPTG